MNKYNNFVPSDKNWMHSTVLGSMKEIKYTFLKQELWLYYSR